MVTKRQLAEQILMRLTGGSPTVSNNIDLRLLMAAIGHAVNGLIKSTYYNETLPSGETIPEGCFIATIAQLPVMPTGDGRSQITLSISPVNLRRGLGVLEIVDSYNPLNVFIPALPGQLALLASQPMISDLMTFTAYERKGRVIVFNRAIHTTTTRVDISLVTLNIELISENDWLPIPSDMEGQVIDLVLKQFAVLPVADNSIDVLTENKAR